MVQTLKVRDSIKVKIANCIFGDQVRKQNFETFQMCVLFDFFWRGDEISSGRDLGIKYAATTVFPLYPTTKNEQTSFVWESP